MKKHTLILVSVGCAAGCALLAWLVILLNSPSGNTSVPDFVMPEPQTAALATDVNSTSTTTVNSFSEAEPQETSTKSESSLSTTADATVETVNSDQPESSVVTITATSLSTTSPAVSSTSTVTTVKPATTSHSTFVPEAETVEPSEPDILPEPELPDNVLLTSGDPLHHIRFEFFDDRIEFTGVYTDLTVSNIGILRERIKSHDLVPGESFSGTLNVSGLTPGYYIIRVDLSDGGIMDYVFEMRTNGAAPLPWTELPADANLSATASPLELPAEGVIQHITSSGDADTAKRILPQVKSLSDEICTGLSSDYDKARALAQWVSRNMYYDKDASENGVTDDMQTLEHVLKTHRSVCFGWSNLYSALCQAQGIWCANASGSVVTGSRCFMETSVEDERSHSWNLLVIDGRRIWVDTVWDSSNSYDGRRYVEGTQDMQYFDISTAALSQDHRVTRFEHRDYFALA